MIQIVRFVEGNKIIILNTQFIEEICCVSVLRLYYRVRIVPHRSSAPLCLHMRTREGCGLPGTSYAVYIEATGSRARAANKRSLRILLRSSYSIFVPALVYFLCIIFFQHREIMCIAADIIFTVCEGICSVFIRFDKNLNSLYQFVSSNNWCFRIFS